MTHNEEVTRLADEARKALRAAMHAAAHDTTHRWKSVPEMTDRADAAIDALATLALQEVPDAGREFPPLPEGMEANMTTWLEVRSNAEIKDAFHAYVLADRACRSQTPIREPQADLLSTLELQAGGEQGDGALLDWMELQGYAYGFEDIHEGNRWTVDGPFNNVRDAIRAAMKSQAV